MAAAADVRAGNAFYELYAKDSLTPMLVRARAAVARFSQFMQSLPIVGGPFAALAKGLGSVAGTVGRVGDFVRGTFLTGARLVRGFGTELLKVGALLTGGALGAASPLLAFFKAGTDRAADLARLNRQLGVPIELLNKLQYAASRAGVSLDEVMGDTQGRYTNLIDQAPPINPVDARAAAEAQKDLADATQSVQDALVPLIQLVAPVVKQFATWVKENADLVAVALPVAAAVAGIGLAVGGIGAALVTAAGAVGAFVLAIKPIAIGAVVVAGLASGVLQLGAVVGGVTYLLARFTDTGRAAMEWLKVGLGNAADAARTALGAMANAIKAGDLGAAFKVATSGLEALWAGLMEGLLKEWYAFTTPLVEGFYEVFGGIGPAVEGMAKLVGDAFRRLKLELGWALEGAQKLWTGLRTGFGQVVDYLEKLWGRFGPYIVDALKPIMPVLTALAAPIVAAVVLVQKAWDGLHRNLTITVARVARNVEEVWARLAGGIENLLKQIARSAVEIMSKAVEQFGALNIGFDAKAALDVLKALKGKIGDDVDVASRVEQIRNAYTKVEQDLLDKQVAARLERERDKTDQLAAAERESVEAKKAHGDAVGAANALKPKGWGESDRGGVLRPDLVPQMSARGQFGGGALQQSLGYGDRTQPQTELLKRLLNGDGALPARIGQEVGGVVAKEVVAAFTVR